MDIVFTQAVIQCTYVHRTEKQKPFFSFMRELSNLVQLQLIRNGSTTRWQSYAGWTMNPQMTVLPKSCSS